MTDVTTVFGSLRDHQKGRIEIISDDPKNYVFSNVFEVAGKSKPYERVAVGKNFEYVIECLRAEGTSPWYVCAHDEFALVMDGKVEVRLRKIDDRDGPAARQERCRAGRRRARRAAGWARSSPDAATWPCCPGVLPTSSMPTSPACSPSRPSRAISRSSAGPTSA